MSKTMDFRVRVSCEFQPELFKALEFFPANSRSELARKAIAEYLKNHFNMNISVEPLSVSNENTTQNNNDRKVDPENAAIMLEL